MTEWNVPAICELLGEAGRIAMHYYESPQTERKKDASLVTAADHAVEEFLTGHLTPGDDGARLIGEETVGEMTQADVEDSLRGTTWVVDPIDGTAPYANRLPTWGITIGLLRDGRYSDGAIFLPQTGEIFITDADNVLYQKHTDDPATWTFDALEPLVPPPEEYSSMGMVSLPHQVIRDGRFSGRNPVQSIGSAVFSIAKLLQGSYVAYVTKLNLWDIAGAVPMLRRFGHSIQFEDGRKLADTVSSDDWVTEVAGGRLWKCRETLFIAADGETLDYIRDNYHGNRR